MRILIAARLSQLSDGQTGLDTQDAAATTFARANGHTVVHVAADRKSGTSAPWDRPELRPWVTEPAKLAQFDAVLAYKLDRLTRGDNASTNAIEKWAHDNGKQLLTVDGLVFPCEGAEAIRWDVTKRIAHQEWLATSERYRRMQTYLRNAGKLVGLPPWGYEVADADGGHKMLIPTDDGRTYIPEIFGRCIAGDSLGDIARWMDGKGVRATSGTKWWARTIGGIIRCTTYTGRRQDASGKTILTCEPLVDASTFRRANAALAGRPKRGPVDEQNRALLSGILRCPRCDDSPMYRIAAGHENTHMYYRCSGRGTQRRGCGNMIWVSAADALVSRFMASLTAPILRTIVIPGHDNQAKIDSLKMDLRGLDFDAPDYDERHAQLRGELASLKDAPVTSDETVTESTGQTYGERWASLDESQRGAYLRSEHVKVYAARTDTGACETAFPDLALSAFGAASLTDDGNVSAVITWLGSRLDDDGESI